MEKKNILVSTLGITWQIIPEILGFTNPRMISLYSTHPHSLKINEYRQKHNIPEVQHIWCITTDHADTYKSAEDLREWISLENIPIDLKVFFLHGIGNLYTEEECVYMEDLIFRVTHTASRECRGGKLILSLAGGRKTMSANMQEAGHIFGCDLLLHVLEGGVIDNRLILKKSRENLYDFSNNIMPIIISDRIPVNPIIQAYPDLIYPSIFNECVFSSQVINNFVYVDPSSSLSEELRKIKNNAGSLIFNYIHHITGPGEKTNFRSLYTLSPAMIQELKNDHLGLEPLHREKELAWLKRLPKCDLHCHLGGVATAEDMIETALANLQRAEQEKNRNTAMKQWVNSVKGYIKSRDVAGLKFFLGDSGKGLRCLFPTVPEPYTVSSFLACFENNTELLDNLIYGELLNESKFAGIGIQRYEALGDLQGSGLMQSEESLRTMCRRFIKKCISENITYCEVRCSPVNYTRGGLRPERVVEIITEELSLSHSTVFRLIFIGSRHGRIEDIKAHVELASKQFKESSSGILAGFDLAGNEAAKSPGEVKELFLPLMENCTNITIHAGEGADPKNIWEAVYHLSADRIGHGLTLHENERLFRKLIDRKISIELCPSSNMQIVGFYSPETPHFKKEYPLKMYMERGLTVTVHTDNPGISRTTISEEYYRASRMTPGGLSKWDVLQLIKNGFKSSFADHETKRNLLLDAEEKIMRILLENNHEEK